MAVETDSFDELARLIVGRKPPADDRGAIEGRMQGVHARLVLNRFAGRGPGLSANRS